MALKETRIVKYEIDTPGFENVEFTESSKDYLIWPKAVKFAADQNAAVLQSVREAGAFRIQAEGKDDVDHYQVTRTGAVYFKDGSKFYVAFDDAPDASQNIVLARVQEGYDANSKRCEWTLSKKDKHIAQILKHAEKSDRIVQVVESPLELATKVSFGSSEFGSNKTVQALFSDVAEPYAGMLHKRGYSKGFIYVLTPENLEKRVADDKTLVRPVGLGGDYYGDIYYYVDVVLAGYRFNYVGRARGVRGAQKFSQNLLHSTK